MRVADLIVPCMGIMVRRVRILTSAVVTGTQAMDSA
jgi:hypothetical protein